MYHYGGMKARVTLSILLMFVWLSVEAGEMEGVKLKFLKCVPCTHSIVLNSTSSVGIDEVDKAKSFVDIFLKSVIYITAAFNTRCIDDHNSCLG